MPYRNTETIILNQEKLFGSKNTKKPYFGRTLELGKLINILEGEEGSTTLVAGDRGSGKTRLIDEALEQVKKPKTLRRRMRSLTFSRSVIVKVPLIPQNTSKEQRRGIVLRAIIHALEVECDSTSSMKRPVLYSHKLKKLCNIVRYTSITEQSQIKASSKASNILQIASLGVTASQLVKSELDLSDIRLELLLTAFLNKYKNKLQFIVIFDELDKYDDEAGDGLSAEDIIKELKNLFTTTGANFVFVSTEDYYRQLESKSSSVDRGVSHTLFSHAILINQMKPKDFLRFLDSLIKNSYALAGIDYYEEFKHAMMWASNLYPFELVKLLAQLSQKGTEGTIIEMHDVEDLFADSWTYLTSLHYVLCLVYEEYSRERDSYFNRYLYRSLRESALLLEKGVDSQPIGRYNALGYVFQNEEFINATEKTTFLEKSAHRLSPPITEDETWKNRIYNLSHRDIERFERAHEKFLWLLNRLGVLSIAFTDGPYVNTPVRVQYLGDTADFGKIMEDISLVEENLREEQNQVLEDIKLLKSKLDNTSISSIDLNEIHTIDISPIANETTVEISWYAHRFLEDIKKDMETITIFQDRLHAFVLDQIRSRVADKYSINPAFIRLVGESNYVTYSLRAEPSKTVTIIYNPTLFSDVEPFISTTTARVIVVSDTPMINWQPHPRVKKYVFVDDWSAFDKSLEQVATDTTAILSM